MGRDGRPWFWKDPRLAVLLPFWKQIWEDVAYIIAVRDPGDIAESLQRRDEFSLSGALLLWQRYLCSILKESEIASSALFVSYEALLDDGVAECTRLCQFLSHRFGTRAEEPGQRPEMMAKAVIPGRSPNKTRIPFSEHCYATPAQKALYNHVRLRAAETVGPVTVRIVEETDWRERLSEDVAWRRGRCRNFVQVFWRDSLADFREGECGFALLRNGAIRQSHRITIPPPRKGLWAALRFDLSQEPGFMRIHRLSVMNTSEEYVWSWDRNPASLEKLPRHDVLICDPQTSPSGTDLCFHGKDPWFELVLTEDQSEAVRQGGAVLLECTYLSTAAMFSEIIDLVSRLNLTAAEQRRTAVRVEEFATLQAQYTGLAVRLLAAEARAEAALKQVTDIYQSKTWRILTAPTGAIRALLRRPSG
jgi:hypothetical protein